MKSYQMHDFIRNNLSAANLYKNLGDDRRQLSSLIRALDGCIIIGDKFVSDSIMRLTTYLIPSHPDFEETLSYVKMAYGIKFDSKAEVRRLLDSVPDITEADDESKLDIAMGLLKLNEPNKATLVFESIPENSPIINSLRYVSIKPDIFEANGRFKDALQAYKDFHTKIESENKYIYSQKTTVAQELNQLKVTHLYAIQSKNRQIWLGVCVLLTLIIVLGIIYYQFRLLKSKRVIAEKEQSRLQLENDNLQKKNTIAVR